MARNSSRLIEPSGSRWLSLGAPRGIRHLPPPVGIPVLNQKTIRFELDCLRCPQGNSTLAPPVGIPVLNQKTIRFELDCLRCPQGNSNPRFGLERAASWATRRWGPEVSRFYHARGGVSIKSHPEVIHSCFTWKTSKSRATIVFGKTAWASISTSRSR